MWSEDTGNNDSPLICRGCFSADTKLHNIYDNNLVNKYVELVGISLPDNFSQYLCVFCKALLLKFWKFKESCHRVQEIFDTACQGTRLSPKSLLELSLTHHKPRYKQTSSDALHKECIETDTEVQIKLEIEENNEYFADETVNVHRDILFIKNDDFEDQFEQKDEIEHKNEFEKEEIDSDRDTPSVRDRVKKGKQKKEKKTTKKAVRVKKDFGRKSKTADDIRQIADMQNFDVVFLTKEEQLAEVEERKNRNIRCCRIGYKKCELCGKNVKGGEQIDGHYKSFHDPSIGALQCDICFCRFKDRRRLNAHLRIHREKFCCRSCDFVAKGEAAVRKHYEWHKGTKFNCQYCGQTFPKLTSCLSHTRLKHANELPWCEICGESFIGEKGVQTHKKLAHRDVEVPNYVCVGCDVHFMSDKALDRHVGLKRCDLSNCVHCGDAFASLQLLKYHLVQAHDGRAPAARCGACGARFHSSAARDTHTSTCGASHPCVQCGLAFQSDRELSDHQAREHPDTDSYKCDECDKVFSSVFYYREHYSRRHHIAKCSTQSDAPARSGPRRWTLSGRGVRERARDVTRHAAVCEVCGKSFCSVALLKYHQRLHSGEGLLACSFCPKKFNVPALLENHTRVHTGERPFKCSLCAKAFKTSVNYKRHLLVHSGLRSHICELCQKTFQTSSCVKSHIRAVHMKIPAPPRVRKQRVKHE